jgi:hypothetical protein
VDDPLRHQVSGNLVKLAIQLEWQASPRVSQSVASHFISAADDEMDVILGDLF